MVFTGQQNQRRARWPGWEAGLCLCALLLSSPAALARINVLTLPGEYHRAGHMVGKKPAGGNLLFLDGHSQWRSFLPDMVIRHDTKDNRAGGTIRFWF